MAILINNAEYKKITSAHINFLENNMIIFSDNYGSKEDRDIEKSILNDRYAFFYKCENYLTENEKQICEKIRAVNNGELQVADIDAFWNEHPELKIEADKATEEREEYWLLRQKLDNEEIDITSLKYLDLWQGFGLDQELVRKITRLGSDGITTELTENTDISTLYNKLKEIIHAESIVDC